MRQRPEAPEDRLEMTPMIDVTFLLLIFFIVTLNFRQLEGRLDASLPKTTGPGTPEATIEPLDITLLVAKPGVLEADPAAPHLKRFVGRQIAYRAGARTYDGLEPLGEFLRSLPDDTPVTLDARRQIVYGDVVPVLDLVIEAGFEQIAFAGSHEEY